MAPDSIAKIALLAGCASMFAVELGLAWRARSAGSAPGTPVFRLKDSLESLCLQAMTGAISHFGKLWLVFAYVAVSEGLAVRAWGGAWWEYLGAFLLYDLLGYVFHRVSHRTALGWAVHEVHHQSEQFNLTVAMRTAPLRSLLDWPTILPLAVLGVPAWWMLVLYVIHVAGQYWIHVTWIPRLGPIEWLVNCPSHHRVHHGCQAGYQDANYGANLIVWDRLFGSFVEESEPARYGVAHPVPGWSPLRSTFGPFARVWSQSRDWRFADRVRVWVMPPGWTPDGSPTRPSPPAPKSDFDGRWLGHAAVYTVLANALLLAMPPSASAGPWVLGLLAAHGAWALVRVASLLEDRKSHPGGELAWIGTLIATASLVPAPWAGLFLTAGLVVLGSVAVRWGALAGVSRTTAG